MTSIIVMYFVRWPTDLTLSDSSLRGLQKLTLGVTRIKRHRYCNFDGKRIIDYSHLSNKQERVSNITTHSRWAITTTCSTNDAVLR